MPIQVTWTVIPNGIANGKLRLALMASIKLSSASTNETTLGASFPAMLNWHKNKFSFVITFAGAMGVKTFNLGPISVPSQTAWPSTFKTDTPVKPYKYESKLFRSWESYSVTQLLAKTRAAYANVTTGAVSPKYPDIGGLIQNQFKAPDIYRSPFFQPREIGTLPNIGGIRLPSIRPPEDPEEGFDPGLWACSDFGTAMVGNAKEMMAMAYAAACDDWRNNGGEMPEEEALWWEARNFHEAYDDASVDMQTRPQVRPTTTLRPGVVPQIREGLIQRPSFQDRYGGKPMVVTPPKLDFHEALSMLGEHPTLMRQFGIIIDLEVPQATANLAPTGSVTASVTWTTDGGGGGSSTENPLTVFQYNAASGIFLPGHKAGLEYKQGFHNLSEDYVQITGVDVDSLAIRVLDFAGTIRSKYAFNARKEVDIVPNPPSSTPTPGAARPGVLTTRPPVRVTGAISSAVQRNPATAIQVRQTAAHQMIISEALFQQMGDRYDTAAPPGLRTAGVSIARKDRSMKLAAVMAVADANMAKMAAPKTVSLYFEDMIRGYRMDVFANGKWHSLTTRKGSYTLPGNISVPNVDEEAWVSTAVSSDPTDKTPANAGKGKVHEVLVRWQGFSQVCQRPGSTADQQGNLIEGNTVLDPRFPIRMQFTPRDGSLPILRFGQQYRFRLRLATVAGTGPELSGPSAGAPYETALMKYRRWESLPSPTLYEQAQTKEGESPNHIVIRKYVANPSQIDPALRQLVPPSGEVSLCETHGMFDKDGKPDPAMYAKIKERDNMAPLPKYVGGKVNRLPYFADPMAQGITVQGAPHVTTNLMLNYPGTWPEQQSLSLEVRAGTGASTASGDKFTFFLTPGEIRFPKFSSSMKPEHADLFALTEWLPAASRASVLANIHLGRVWTITPFRESTVIFATQIPEQMPLPDRPYSTRVPGSTRATIGGRIQTHSWTTASVDFNAHWTDDVDLLDEPQRTTEKQDKSANAFKLKIVRGPSAPVVFQPFTENHEFGDTKHHEVSFDLVAHSPYKQYFPASWPLDSNPEGTRFTESKENAFTIHVPASTRPDTPHVEYIVPTFGWSMTRSADGKTITSSRDGNGLRVYLRRPWYSSGNDEKLGVVFLSGNAAAQKKIDAMSTIAGADPVFKSGDIPANFGPASFLGGGPARGNLGAPDVAGATATVVPYDVHFDADRQMWYADITVNTGGAYTPFVRLALARYQQYALPGLNLSGITVADIMQIQMDRTASVVFNDAAKKINVSVIGVASESSYGPNRLFGTIEEKVGADDETGWRTVLVGGKELSRSIPIKPPLLIGTIGGVTTRPPGTVIRPPLQRIPPPEGEENPEAPDPHDEGSMESDAQRQTRPPVQTPPIRPGVLNPQIRPNIGNLITPPSVEGEFTLPKARTEGTYRLVIREYEVFDSDSFESEMPEVPAPAAPTNRSPDPDAAMVRIKPGARLVYMDVIPLS